MRAGETVYAPRMGLLFVCQVKSDFHPPHRAASTGVLPSASVCYIVLSLLGRGVGWYASIVCTYADDYHNKCLYPGLSPNAHRCNGIGEGGRFLRENNSK